MCQSLQSSSNTSFVFFFNSVEKRYSKTNVVVAEENILQISRGMKINGGQGEWPWQCVVENTRLWCHLLLSNIIGLEGLMLRTVMLLRTTEHTNANQAWQRTQSLLIEP